MTTKGELLGMMYTGQSTDVLSLYFSQLAAVQKSSAAEERIIAQEIRTLRTLQARYKRDLAKARAKGGSKEQLHKQVRNLRGTEARLMVSLAQLDSQAKKLASSGQAAKITVAEMRQKAEEKAEKKFILSATARREIRDLANAAQTQMGGTNPAVKLTALIREAAAHKALTAEQKTVYSRELLDEWERIRNQKSAAGAQVLSSPALETIITDELTLDFVPDRTDIEADIARAAAEAASVYEGLSPDAFVASEGADIRSRMSSKLSGLRKQLKKAERELGATEQKRADELLKSAELAGYLADVADDYLLNQSAGEYDLAAADTARQELLGLAEAEPALIRAETQAMLDPEFVRRERELMTARSRRKAEASPPGLDALMMAPQISGLDSVRDLRQLIKKERSQVLRDQLTAELVAQENPDSAYARAFAAASPGQRVIFASLPSVEARIKSLTKQAEPAELRPENEAEKRAVKALQTLSSPSAMDGATLVRLADENYKRNPEKRQQFVSYIMTAQRYSKLPDKSIQDLVTAEVIKADQQPTPFPVLPTTPPSE